jgi:hypothetical protein
MNVLLQETLDYDHPTVNFYDIEQELFDSPKPEEPTQRKLHSTTLQVNDADDGEIIDDEDSPQWMDDKLFNVIGEDDFGHPEEDINLDAPELEEILADARLPTKGKAKAVEMVVEMDNVSEDEDAELDWSV